MRVCVVEDHPDTRLLVQLMLDQKGYSVTLFPDGRAALAGLEAADPDLVLLDISLPMMSGEEVLAAIRTMPGLEGVPVVAFTAHAMAEDRERFLALGFDGYLSKPILDPNKSRCRRWRAGQRTPMSR